MLSIDPTVYVKYRAEQAAVTREPEKFFDLYRLRAVAYRTAGYEYASVQFDQFIEPYRLQALGEIQKAIEIASATFEAHLTETALDGSHDTAALTDLEKFVLNELGDQLK